MKYQRCSSYLFVLATLPIAVAALSGVGCIVDTESEVASQHAEVTLLPWCIFLIEAEAVDGARMATPVVVDDGSFPALECRVADSLAVPALASSWSEIEESDCAVPAEENVLDAETCVPGAGCTKVFGTATTGDDDDYAILAGGAESPVAGTKVFITFRLPVLGNVGGGETSGNCM